MFEQNNSQIILLFNEYMFLYLIIRLFSTISMITNVNIIDIIVNSL